MNAATLPSGAEAVSPAALARLRARLAGRAAELGFDRIGVARIALTDDERHLLDWLGDGCHGTMRYMARHHRRRAQPAEILPGTLRVVSATLNYFPADAAEAWSVLNNPEIAYVARYALGRDYHRLVRPRLARLAEFLTRELPDSRYRVFVDSGPVLERALARDAGLGWIGKHTNLIHREDGSYFFIGEILTDLPLPADPPFVTDHCGRCTACIDVCPTRAIVAPYRLDARRCISYLTIEHRGSIPEPLRRPIGNRIFGCDDCQLVCPWNRHATPSREGDLEPRAGLDAPDLIELFAWDEATYLEATRGSPLRRPGYVGWLRNLAVALGNGLAAKPDPDPARAATREAWVRRAGAALERRAAHPDPIVREHVHWALAQSPH